MKEKTLLYGALAATALAAAYGVHRGRRLPARTEIVPVSLSDSTKSVPRAEAPIQLTASDGTGLRLASIRASGAIEDPLALTELHLVFENPQDRVLEGTFRITLPQGASLSRFAMRIGDRWQEGEVVEKQAARRVYEDFLHRRQDPALLEQSAGNEFTARVFPIPAHGTKELVVAYSEVLEAGAPYVLPLQGLPMVGSVDVDVRASQSSAPYSLHQRDVTPAGDFVVEAKHIPRSAGLRSGDVMMMRVVPFTTSRPEPISSAIFLVDTSASRALGLTEQAHLVERTLSKLPPDTKVQVACFDQEIVSIYEGNAGGFGPRETAAIVARDALGASDFEAALAWAREQAKRTHAKRVVFVGDGVATAGETDAQRLAAKVEGLRATGVERLDAIAVGGLRDDAFLRSLVRGVLDRDGVVLDAKLGPEAVARRLNEATSSAVPVSVEGASWSWPRTLDGLQAGDEVVVYASLPESAPAVVRVGTQEFRHDLRSVDRALLGRAWAEAKIASLLEAPTADPATTKQEIVALSTRHRVLSPYTALLVLESDADYRRYGIDPAANVDVLTVRDGRIAVVTEDRGWTEKNDRTTATKNRPGAGAHKGDLGRSAEVEEAERADDLTATLEDTPAQDGASGRIGHGAGGGERSPVPRGAASDVGEGAGAEPAPPPPAPMELPAAKPETKEEAKKKVVVTPKAPARPAPPRKSGVRRRTLADGDPWSPSPSPRPAATTTATTPARPLGPASGAASATTTPFGNVREGALVVSSGISRDEAQRVVRQAMPRMRACYTQELRSAPTAGGEVSIDVTIDRLGAVKRASVTRSTGTPALDACASSAIRALRFPAPETGDASFVSSFQFVPGQGAPIVENAPAPSFAGVPTNIPHAAPYEGHFKVVMDDLARGDAQAALDETTKWRSEEPGDVMALVALGEVMEKKGDLRTAARAYGSILELFSARADSRRFAGERLERLNDRAALLLAADTYGKAAQERPDHPASHRLHAFALLKLGEHERAFEALRAGLSRSYPAGRFAGAQRILGEDLGLIAAAWTAAQPGRAAEIERRLREAGGTVERDRSLRFVLVWETDANDVDFHIYDARGGHAYYANRDLPSGGSLYADVTTGYGPECFTIRGPNAARAYPYTLQAHYYSRGPMGYGMGKLEVVEHDGKGHLSFDERPFVVMADRAFVDLGRIDRDTTNAKVSD